MGDPIKVAKKMRNPLIFFCLVNVTKECIKMKEEAFSIKDITKFSGHSVLVSSVINCLVEPFCIRKYYCADMLKQYKTAMNF